MFAKKMNLAQVLGPSSRTSQFEQINSCKARNIAGTSCPRTCKLRCVRHRGTGKYMCKCKSNATYKHKN